MTRRLNDSDLKTFSDGTLCVSVPSYLRQQKEMLLFKAPSRKYSDRCLDLVAVLTETEESRRIGLEALANNPRSVQNWMGVTTKQLRAGPAEWATNGFEVFYHREHEDAEIDIGATLDYGLHFELEPGIYVQSRIAGHGGQQQFERLVKQIVLSVRRRNR